MKNRFKYILILIIGITLLYIFYNSYRIRSIFFIIFMSFIFAYILKPFNDYLSSKGIKKKFSALILLITIFLVMISLIILLVPAIIRESNNITKTSTEIYKYINEKIKFISNDYSNNKVLIEFYNKIDYIIRGFINNIIELGIQIGENILAIAVIPVISYYFLSEGNNIKYKLLNLFDTKWRSIIRRTLEDIDKNLSRYIVGELILCLIISVLTFIVLFFLKVDYPLILSLINGVFNVIPYFGPVLGAIPAIIIAFLESPKQALWTVVWLYILQIIEGNIICPKIIGESVNIHPLLVIILLLIGEKFGGFIGMILIIPICVILKVIYEDINYYLY